jgi:SWI/SNF-related matrix-associated actin-dependent regulator of chromatin subfamily A3
MNGMAVAGYDYRAQAFNATYPASQAHSLSAAQMAAQQETWAKAAELRQILSNLEKVDDEGRRESLLDTLCSVDDVLKLPVHPSPPGIANGELRVDLLKHQVRWPAYAIGPSVRS